MQNGWINANPQFARKPKNFAQQFRRETSPSPAIVVNRNNLRHCRNLRNGSQN